MTRLLQRALEQVRSLSPAEQDDIARMMLSMSHAESAEDVSPQHLSAILEGLDQIRRGERATDAEVEAAFRRFDQ